MVCLCTLVLFSHQKHPSSYQARLNPNTTLIPVGHSKHYKAPRAPGLAEIALVKGRDNNIIFAVAVSLICSRISLMLTCDL